jgi:ATP-binding cassette, subfamily F, member 3
MINLRKLSLRRGAKLVLQDAQLTLHAGEKVGLVGRNGAGKTSLFHLLAGRLHPDAGELEMPQRWRLAEVAQDMPESSDSATTFVLQGDLPLQKAEAALARALAAGDGEGIAHAHVSLEEAGAFDAEARAQALLLGLGFRSAELAQPVNSFSGGWRMRLQLARALMCPADLLLLDEPTNHLDLDALVWLEDWLKRYAGTLIVISHDREFLDAICKVTAHLDALQLTRYTGNYTAFEMARAERLGQAQAAFERQQERMAQLQRFIDRFKAKASKAKQAQSRVKALARMEKLAPVLTASDFSFEFREPASLPNPMLALDGLACGYAPGQAIVKKVSRSVLAGQRIGILGANGQGKSTLVKTIARTLPPLEGRLTEGKGLVVGYFAQQELDVLSLGDGPLMHLVRLARDVGPPAREQELRDFLGRFRFTGDMVQQAVGTLSGGEKARLVLAMLVWQRPNLLLLDEPTNHLDLDTREALSIALNEFEGTVLLVSHDRALLREVCDEFWLVTRGGVEAFDGDLDDYQRWLLDVSRALARGQAPPPVPQPERVQDSPRVVAATPKPKPKPKPTPVPTSTPTSTSTSITTSTTKVPSTAAPSASASPASSREGRQADKQARARLSERSRPLRVELQQLEARLARLGQERAEVETELAAPGLAGEGYAEFCRRLAHVQAELAMLEERWVEVQSELEALQA